MKGFEKFLSKDELKEKAKDWKLAALTNEYKRPGYRYDRVDIERKGGLMSISDLHGVSFIKEVIPNLVASKPKGEKVRILDIGSGAAFFVDEIRKEFSDQVQVFSTGLSKKVARDFRKLKKPEGEHRLHPDDLKWRSISELSDFEEFDLIIDTWGELEYAHRTGLDIKTQEKKVVEYLVTVIKKLKPHGLASLVPSNLVIMALGPMFRQKLNEIEREYGVRIIVSFKEQGFGSFASGKNSPALWIEKNKPK